MYRVIRAFCDMQDNGYEYHEGDVYPRGGRKPQKNRVAYLMSCENRLKTPVIAGGEPEEAVEITEETEAEEEAE